MTARYTLCAPIPEGDQYWQINDQEKQFNLESLHKDFPFAEWLIRLMFEIVTLWKE